MSHFSRELSGDPLLRQSWLEGNAPPVSLRPAAVEFKNLAFIWRED
jgi:hypothetical protein